MCNRVLLFLGRAFPGVCLCVAACELWATGLCFGVCGCAVKGKHKQAVPAPPPLPVSAKAGAAAGDGRPPPPAVRVAPSKQVDWRTKRAEQV